MKRLLPLIAVLLAALPCQAGVGRNIQKGATDQTTYVRIVDATDGTPETGVTSATSGLDLEYVRLGAAPVDLTESDLGSTSAAHSDGGLIHVGGGVYRVDLPDAAVATGVDQVSVQGTITDMVILGVTHPLVDLSLSGQSALDLKDFADAGYDPANKVITGIAGTVNDFDELLSGSDDFDTAFQASATTFFGATGGNLTSLASAANLSTLTGYVDTEIGAIKTKTDFLPSATAGAAGGLTIAGSNAATTFATLTSSGALTINGTAHVAQTGDAFARLGAPAGASIAEDISNVDGGAGGTDWSSDERSQIRNRLGIDGTAASPAATPTLATAAALSSVATSATTAASEATAANTKAGDIQSRLPATLNGGLMRSDATLVADAELIEDLSASLIAGGVGGAPISAKSWSKAWRFDSVTRITANNTVSENSDFDGIVAMEFKNALPQGTRIYSIGTPTITPTSGIEPQLGTPSVDPTNMIVLVPINVKTAGGAGIPADAGTYTITVPVLSTDSQNISRKGFFVRE